MKTMSAHRLRHMILRIFLISSIVSCTKQPEQVASAPLDVMSFNIRYGTANDGDNAWPLRKDLAFEVIKQADPDVLGLQEALHFQLLEVLEALPQYALVGVGRDDGEQAGEYAAILYDSTRFDLLSQGTFWFSDTPEVVGSTSWGNSITRICSWAQLRDRSSQKAIYAYNVHWDHRSQPSRERSAGLLLSKIAKRSNPEAPVVVTGDFNAGEDNPAFVALLNDDTIQLHDSYRSLHPDALEVGTFNGFVGTSDGDKIDAILLSGGLRSSSAEIVRTHQDGRYPSDHFPITAHVEFVKPTHSK